MELMVVVSIIGLSAALAMPAVTAGLVRNRHSRAIKSIISTAREAHQQALGNADVYLLHISTASGDNGGFGRVEVWQGTDGRCNAVPWVNIMAVGCENSLLCHAEYDPYEFGMTDATKSDRETEILVALGSEDEESGDFLQLCYDGDGSMSARTNTVDDFSTRVATSAAGPRILVRMILDGKYIQGVDGTGTIGPQQASILFPHRGMARRIY